MPDQTWGDTINYLRSNKMPDDQIVKSVSNDPELSPKIKKLSEAGMPVDQILSAIKVLPRPNAPPLPTEQAEPSFGERAAGIGKALAKRAPSDAFEVQKGFLKEGAKTIYNASRAAEKSMTFGLGPLLEEKLNPELHRQRQQSDQYVNDKLTPTNPQQKVGSTAENIAEWAIPVGGPELKLAESTPLLLRAGAGALRGAIDLGLRGYLKTGGDTAEALKQAVFGAAAGGVFGPLIPASGKWLARAARNQYAKLLHPAGKGASKTIEDIVLPEAGKGIPGMGSLLDRGMKAIGSMDKLHQTAEAEFAKSLKEMHAVYDSYSPQEQQALKPAIDGFTDYLNKTFKDKSGEFINEDAEKKFKLGKNILERYIKDRKLWGPQQSGRFDNIVSWKRYVDNVKHKAKIDVPEEATSLYNEMNDELNEKVKEIIHSDKPDTRDVDRAVAFQSAVLKTIARARSMDFGKDSGLMEKAATYRASRIAATTTIGGIIGGEEGYRKGKGGADTAISAITGTLAGAALGAAWTSPMWRSTSAVAQNNVAKWIARGRADIAAQIAQRAIGWGILKTTPPPDTSKPEPKEKATDAPPSPPPPQYKPRGEDPNGWFRQ